VLDTLVYFADSCALPLPSRSNLLIHRLDFRNRLAEL
jgi:hypothetical protein